MMKREILGKAEVGSSILPGGTINPQSSKGLGVDLNPTPQVLRPELPANSPPKGGENPGRRSARVPKKNHARRLPAQALAVYFVKAWALGYIKIGKADCVHTRFRVLRSQSPDTLVLLGAIVTDRGTALERELHQRFAEHRLHGEWFKPAPELLAFIEANAAPPPPKKHWREVRGRMRTLQASGAEE